MDTASKPQPSPWHEGELELQRSVGAVDQMEAVGRKVLRSFMLEQLSAEYITTARVKGMPESRVIWVHAMRNVMVPLITVVGLDVATTLAPAHAERQQARQRARQPQHQPAGRGGVDAAAQPLVLCLLEQDLLPGRRRPDRHHAGSHHQR